MKKKMERKDEISTTAVAAVCAMVVGSR